MPSFRHTVFTSTRLCCPVWQIDSSPWLPRTLSDWWVALLATCFGIHLISHNLCVNRPYSHKLLTINNYVNCPSNLSFARSIYLFHPPENPYANTVYSYLCNILTSWHALVLVLLVKGAVQQSLVLVKQYVWRMAQVYRWIAQGYAKLLTRSSS